MTDFINDYTNFFEDGAYYEVSKFNADNSESSELELLSLTRNACGYGEVQFANWHNKFGMVETFKPHSILLYPELLEEWECSNDWTSCSINKYTLDKGALSLDGKELKFNITLKEGRPSKEFNVISIRKF
ncbi:hypothetical protein [Wolbachia endosymbiont of Ctenocephalides felis wCfeJ]|uniref:hypothetical protein n=1 Tax=Wolbachia endosymbiont of Ctenocephalides felis wCfeJ TaxID=2732594 RepID=UPI001447F385|nr:hypothetical protein [Wolbachia endosymbiont of Ctenocephalides felis wCfeJ]WCR58491.1 MAG: hypothetical protein PG980_000963 [Wolbachia endosymbiont of Ctenocephalides felis wCfeJ]